MIAARSERYAEALHDLDEALILCRAMPYPYTEAKALWVYGQLEAAGGDPMAAAEHFAAALAICAQLGKVLYRPLKAVTVAPP
jgi:hypothetical protein